MSCSLFSVNNLTSLEDFAHCPSLQELYIRKNRVEDLRDVHYLKKLERLRVLWLSDNPCAEQDNYRMTVLRTLPNLQKLDNVGTFIGQRSSCLGLFQTKKDTQLCCLAVNQKYIFTSTGLFFVAVSVLKSA